MNPLEGDIIEPPEGYDEFLFRNDLEALAEKHPPRVVLKMVRKFLREIEEEQRQRARQ